MTRYYKATRPDGTDFRTGRIDYAAALASGATVTHPTGENRLGDPATYLSVAIAPTDCTGMSWPCRLFEVAPVGRALCADVLLPNKRRVRALRVVAELPAHEALGPQGEQVASLIERCRMTADEAVRMDAARAAARAAAWDAAWAAARAAARDAARAAAWDAAWDAAWAAAGLVVRDLITPAQFNALYGPWAAAIGNPAVAP